MLGMIEHNVCSGCLWTRDDKRQVQAFNEQSVVG